jgi:6,7-dimethyl-8-ribityllumazine synthase
MHIANKKNLQEITGIQQYKDACIIIVKTEWNNHITDVMETNCLASFKEYGITSVKTFVVPGAIELPFAIRSIVTKETRVDAVIAFGCVIKGGTPHFEYVCQSVTNGITQLNLTLNVPIVYGVLTVDFEHQALVRIDGTKENKGTEAAITAIKMLQYKF